MSMPPPSPLSALFSVVGNRLVSIVFFLVFGSAAFLLLGLLQAGYGPALPLLTLAGAAYLGSAHFLGSALGILLSGVMVSKLGLTKALGLGLTLMGLGLGGVALGIGSDTGALALLGALTAGFGLGGVSAGLNVAAAGLGAQSGRALNLINAFFGLGAVLSPLLVGLAGGLGRVEAAFGFYALLAAALLVPLLMPSSRLRLPEAAGEQAAPVRANPALLLAFCLSFGLYVGLEASLATWLTSALSHAGHAGAAALTTGFWLALTLGRFAAAYATARRPELTAARLVTLCLTAGSVVLLLAGLLGGPLQGALLVSLGFFLGPVFPSAFGWAAQHLPAAQAPLVLAAGALGGFLAAGALGFLASGMGGGALLPAFLVLALITLLAVVGLGRYLGSLAVLRR